MKSETAPGSPSGPAPETRKGHTPKANGLGSLTFTKGSKAEARKSIHLFDLDDTLIQTAARVRVMGLSGSLSKFLSPAEFSVYQPSPEERFDFTEFSDLGILSRGIIVKYTKGIIDTILQRGTRSHFGILTARSDKNLHAAFLIRLFRSLFGIRLAKEHIFAVSDQRFATYKDRTYASLGGLPRLSLAGAGLVGHYGRGHGGGEVPRFQSLSISERKAMVIAEDLVGRGFNDISFYDDSRENLESFKVLRGAFPHVIYKPHFIDPTWRARLQEFADSAIARKPLIKGMGSVRLILEHHAPVGAQPEDAVRRLHAGEAIKLEGFEIWLKHGEGKYYLSRT